MGPETRAFSLHVTGVVCGTWTAPDRGPCYSTSRVSALGLLLSLRQAWDLGSQPAIAGLFCRNADVPLRNRSAVPALCNPARGRALGYTPRLRGRSDVASRNIGCGRSTPRSPESFSLRSGPL